MNFHRIACTLIALVVLSNSWGQKTKSDRFPSYFGIFVSPVVPNNFIGDVETNMQDSAKTMFATYKHQWGINFGATVRIGLTKNISLETGISQVRRNYLVSVEIPDSSFSGDQKLAFVNYDIPINALFYVQLSEKWYMNASIGFSINQYPSDSRDTILFNYKNKASVEARRTVRTSFAANAGLGFEYRTEDYGTFYFGGGAKVPFKDPFYGVVIGQTVSNGNDRVAFSPISTGYFTIDFRYFIPYKRAKDGNIHKPLN